MIIINRLVQNASFQQRVCWIYKLSSGKISKTDLCKLNFGNGNTLIIVNSSYGFVRQRSTDASENNEVRVYSGPLKTKVKVVKFISLSSSMMGFAVLPFLLFDLSKISLAMCFVTGIVSTTFLSTPLMLNWITKRYVIELNFNPETKIFTAKTFDLFSRIKEIQFTADDVTVPDVPGILSSILVKDIPLFVDSRMITNTEAYSHMMGYDKPFDFRLYLEKDNIKDKDS